MASIRRPFTTLFLILLGLAAVSPARFVWADGINRGEDPGEYVQIPGLPFPVPVQPHDGKPGATPGFDADRLDQARRAMPFDPNSEMPPVAGRDRAGNLGSTVIGPGGVYQPFQPPPRRAEVPKKRVPTAEEKAAAIRKALTPKPPLAFARRQTLDTLYGKLAVAGDEDEAKGLATLIANIWMRTGSDTAALLMQRAGQSIAAKDYPVALRVLDKVVELQPNWAEAWNKRASVRFIAGDLDGSMADVEHVLRLEPKHFGALQGMGMILQRTGFDKQALEVYRRELSIYPHQPELQETVDKLTLHVEGQGI